MGVSMVNAFIQVSPLGNPSSHAIKIGLAYMVLSQKEGNGRAAAIFRKSKENQKIYWQRCIRNNFLQIFEFFGRKVNKEYL